jgi:hypothetical protein
MRSGSAPCAQQLTLRKSRALIQLIAPFSRSNSKQKEPARRTSKIREGHATITGLLRFPRCYLAGQQFNRGHCQSRIDNRCPHESRNGPRMRPPAWERGFAGETNSRTSATSPKTCCPIGRAAPQIVFMESNAAGEKLPCPAATLIPITDIWLLQKFER